MKRIVSVLLCALLLASAAAACGQETAGETSSQGSSSVSSENSDSSMPASSAPVSSQQPASSQASSSQPEETYPSGADYTLETQNYPETAIEDTAISITLPVMTGEAAQRYNGVNGQISRQVFNAASQVIQESGYTGGTLTLTSETPFYSNQLLSIVMTIDYTADGMAYPVHTVKTCNILLDETMFVGLSDAVEDNSQFRAALSGSNDTGIDEDTLTADIANGSLYFAETGIGIVLPVPHAAGDAAVVMIPYSETQDFRTDSPVWNYFQ